MKFNDLLCTTPCNDTKMEVIPRNVQLLQRVHNMHICTPYGNRDNYQADKLTMRRGKFAKPDSYKRENMVFRLENSKKQCPKPT